jgi:hypothetical protein
MSTSARETSSSAAAALPIGISKLAAAGPAPEFEDKLTLFGRFVGSWDVVNVVLNEDDGTAVHESRGEWHFFWILGGRGIQDVLYAVGWSPDRFGSTYRCYDAEADLWRCTWMIPAGGEDVNLVAREVEAESSSLATDRTRRGLNAGRSPRLRRTASCGGVTSLATTVRRGVSSRRCTQRVRRAPTLSGAELHGVKASVPSADVASSRIPPAVSVRRTWLGVSLKTLRKRALK